MKVNMQNVTLAVTAGLTGQFPRDAMPQAAFSGRSNVGKSSLINSLIGRKSLARVSSAPGKTITINFYDIDKKMYFVDLPGYGYAKRPPADKERWSRLVDGYMQSFATDGRAKLIIQLIDAKAGVTKDDEIMIDWLSQSGVPFIIAATKVDKLNKTDRAASLDELSQLGVPVIPFSALSGEGKNEILGEIMKYM